MLSINADTLGKLLTILVASVFLALGVFYFNDADTFAYLFYLILLFSAFLCRKQPNIRGVIAIIFIGQVCEEPVWLLLINYKNELLLLLIYIVLGAGVWFLGDDKKTKLLTRVLYICMISAEIFWYVTDYQSPLIYPYLAIIVHSLVVQWLIFLRAMFGYKYRWMGLETALDFKIYKIARWTIYLQSLHIAEFFIRHILGVNVLIIYTLVPYISHAIAVYTLYLLFDASYKQLLNKKLKA